MAEEEVDAVVIGHKGSTYAIPVGDLAQYALPEDEVSGFGDRFAGQFRGHGSGELDYPDGVVAPPIIRLPRRR